MRFITMHKVDRAKEHIPPSPELIASMGQLVGDLMQSGAFVSGEGLQQTKTRVRLNHTGGEFTLTHGPYAPHHEVYAGFALMRVSSMDEAVEWGKRFAKVLGDVELELGPLNEPWDLGMVPKPADAPLRVLALHKTNAEAEAGIKPSPKLFAQMGKLMEDMAKAGVLITATGFEPSSKGARITYENKRRKLVDGPFTESKELIGGYVMLDVKSRDELLVWMDRFAEAIGDVEIDVRLVSE